MELTAAELDLDAEVDAMIIEHLDTAPMRKPKGAGRRKGKQPLATKMENVELDSIIPDLPEREPTVEITIPEAETGGT